MNKERLKHLIAIMERVEREDLLFNMAYWFKAVSKTETECGTACCVIGYACMDKEFQEQGFMTVYRGSNDRIISEGSAQDLILFYKRRSTQIEPFFDDRFGYEAAAAFFEISSDQSHELFTGSRYDAVTGGKGVKPRHVIARLRNLIGE